MRKELRKYLLTLCILLLNGYSSIYAKSCQNYIFDSSINNLKNSQNFNFALSKNYQTPAIGSSLSDQKENYKICSEKNEEEIDKLVSLKTFTAVSNYFSALYTHSSRCLFSQTKTHLPVFEHWFYSSSHRYDILRVLRI